MIDILVNKKHRLDKSYIPEDLVITDDNKNNIHRFIEAEHKPSVTKEVFDAFIKMQKDAKKDNINIIIDSGYRSYEYQQKIWDTYMKKYGEEYTVSHVAPPGASEHQTGLAIDIASFDNDIINDDITEESKEYIWMINNSYKYGFILRYPKGEEDITGYAFEPWHFRYIGVELATYIHNNQITLEKYYLINNK